MRRLTVTALVALVLAAPAQGAPVRGLHIGGQMPRAYWAWAVDASERVQLPDARFDLFLGYNPLYRPDYHEMYLPAANRRGWSLEVVHGLFLHELGHVYDFTMLTPSRRLAFKRAVGVTCKWWTKCVTRDWSNGDLVRVFPGEMFAEQYAACALGLSQLDYQEGDHTSYGWLPPKGTDETLLCALMR